MTHDFEPEILSLLAAGELHGRELRRRLRDEFAIRMSAPRFYNQMSKLEDAGKVRAEKREFGRFGHKLSRRFYSLPEKVTR